MDMTDLQGDGAQDTEKLQTDPRSALADVERLAQAWHMTQRCVHGKGSGEPMQTVGYLDPDREVARDILDEYARLTAEATE